MPSICSSSAGARLVISATRGRVEIAASASPRTDSAGSGTEQGDCVFDLAEFGRDPGAVGLERGDDRLVDRGGELGLRRAAALGRGGAQGVRPLQGAFDAHGEVGEFVAARRVELGLGRGDERVEAEQLVAQFAVLFGLHRPRVVGRLQPGRERRDLAAGEEQPQRFEFAGDVAVATRRVGLTLERLELPAYLTQQVVQANEVALGRLEPTLRLLATAAELQYAGGLFDDGAPVFGARVEHSVELALAHDHVLRAANAGVRQQLLDVEQAARHFVDRVFALARCPEQRAGDRDLGEVDRQDAGRVVDRQADFGATERGTIRRSRRR